jgi:hypothetical protein
MRKLILATMVLMLLSSVSFGADWIPFSNDLSDDSPCYYDSQSITREGSTIRVWGKRILSDKAKGDYIKNHPKIHNIENINYTIGRWEVDCLKYQFRVLSSSWYGSDGNTIYSGGSPNSQFREVVPGSVMDKLVEIFCKKGEGASK